MNRLTGRLGLTLALLTATLPAMAQGYPNKPIRLVVPTSTGTATDLTARYVAERLARELGTAVVVENKTGANGIIATEAVARSTPDGYTLLVAASTHYINKALYTKLSFDPISDFTPVARFNAAYLVLVTPKSTTTPTVASLRQRMKAQPRTVTYSTAGSGSTTHLAATLLTSTMGVEALHVPYKGGAQAMTDTIGGQVDFTFTAIAQAAPHIKADKLTPLAITSLRRTRSLPDVPTLHESGLPGFEIASRLGLMAPAGTPAEVIDRLAAAASRIARTKEFAEFCESQGLEVDFADPAAYAAAGREELQMWTRVVAISGARVD